MQAIHLHFHYSLLALPALTEVDIEDQKFTLSKKNKEVHNSSYFFDLLLYTWF